MNTPTPHNNASSGIEDDYDLKALIGAAEFFENLATGADPAPLAFAQAIRRALPALEMMAEMDDDANYEPTAEEQADSDRIVQGAWQRFVESMPAARVVNDNGPGNEATILVLRDPPILPVGTLLYASYQGIADNAVAVAALEAADRAERARKGTDEFAAILKGTTP